MAVNQIFDPTEPTGRLTFARKAGRWIDHRVLAANVEQEHTVPAGAKYVVFQATDIFYARPNETAAIPTDTVSDGTGAEINPPSWRLVADGDEDAVTTISLISPFACVVSLIFHKD